MIQFNIQNKVIMTQCHFLRLAGMTYGTPLPRARSANGAPCLAGEGDIGEDRDAVVSVELDPGLVDWMMMLAAIRDSS